MRQLRKPISLKLGLEPFLEATKDLHRGYGYEDWIKNYPQLGKSGLGDLFGVDRSRIYDWIKQYEIDIKKVADNES